MFMKTVFWEKSMLTPQNGQKDVASAKVQPCGMHAATQIQYQPHLFTVTRRNPTCVALGSR